MPPLSAPTRRLLACSVVLATLTSVTACSSNASTPATAPTSSTASATAATTGAPSPATTAASPVPAATAATVASVDDANAPEPFIPTWIPGLRIERDGTEDAACAWSTAYPVIPGADALTKALAARAAAWLVTARSAAPAPDLCADGRGANHTEVTFDILVASGDVVGVRLNLFNGNSAGSGRSTDTFWLDGRTLSTAPAASLVDATKSATFTQRLQTLLADQEGYDAGAATAALAGSAWRTTLKDLSFDAAGNLRVRIPAGAIAAVAAGEWEAVLPRAEAAALLSDLGRRAQEQAIRSSRSLTLGTRTVATPAPTVAAPVAGAVPSPAGSGAGGGAGSAAARAKVDCRAVKCVALTFDDGPGPYTRKLLSILAAHNARATFFLIGQSVAADPSTVRAEVAAGHEIGNHSWSHRDLSRLSGAALKNELEWADRAIERAVGFRPPLLRPPYGAYNATVRAAATEPIILWNVDTLDWKSRNAAKVQQAALSAARPGAIILMHDIHPTTVAAVPAILSALSAQGYRFVTVSELEGTTLTPGKVYSSGLKG